jgi:hypothetical protein
MESDATWATVAVPLGIWLVRFKTFHQGRAPPACEYAANGSCHTAFPYPLCNPSHLA